MDFDCVISFEFSLDLSNIFHNSSHILDDRLVDNLEEEEEKSLIVEIRLLSYIHINILDNLFPIRVSNRLDKSFPGEIDVHSIDDL